MVPLSLLRCALSRLDSNIDSFALQCPIGPNSTYTYCLFPHLPCCDVSDTYTPLFPAFDVPESGTYWYHSHLSTQYLDGLRGVIVVYVRVSRVS